MSTVQTTSGALSGTTSEFDDSIRVFKGIPYAKPPVGDLRWKSPQKPDSWKGTRDATAFGTSCTQARHTSVFVWRREDFEVSEDCLYLNVWSKKNANNQPVMVWFHGGAHTSGQGHSKIFDGTELSSQGVVLVTINYRLGPFGFLAHPWLAEASGRDSAGNYGLMDKIAALEWVRDNIKGFGGNPDNVTVFGQSAGSQSICSLMASAQTKGLFHKAIGQSASCVNPAPVKDMNGRERGEKFVAALPVENLAELRAIKPEDVLKASVESGWAAGSRIVIDGAVLTEPQVETYRKGNQAQIPLMLGSLADEGVELFPKNPLLTEEQLTGYLSNMVGDQAAALEAVYSDVGSPGDIQHAIATDMFMAFGMRRWAEYSIRDGNETYLYFMDHVPPAFHIYMPEDPVLELADGPRSGGAYHSGDLAFVFGNIDRVGLNWNDDDRRLSSIMVRYWTNFAKSGNPNGEGVPEWRQFNNKDYPTQVLNPSAHNKNGVRRKALDILAKVFPE
ncbi:MAG TPA: carboxylesterase family protein [Pseudomonadales bacterium]|nr:carboxylesterase family protein [Pseudomonadales bacterium]